MLEQEQPAEWPAELHRTAETNAVRGIMVYKYADREAQSFSMLVARLTLLMILSQKWRTFSFF
jgi:hypothetical protein